MSDEEGQLRRQRDDGFFFGPSSARYPEHDHAKDIRTIEEAFQRFHEANPHVYREIVRVARVAKGGGYDRWSIKGIYEIIRWDSIDTDETPKLPNNFTSRYARLVMDSEPDLAEFFVTHKLTAP